MIEDAPESACLLADLARLPAAGQLDRLRRFGPIDDVLLSLVDEAVELISSEAGRALDATGLVLTLADRHGSALTRARARRARARALAYAGRYDEGLVTCIEAIDLAFGADDPVEAGRARLASMHALGELGRLDEAIAAGHRARDVFLAAEEPALAARADINLANIHQKQDQPNASLECLARARPFVLDDTRTRGILDNSRGEALIAINDFMGAEQAFLAALDAFQHDDAELMSAIVEGNLADLAARQGRLERSLYFFECARRHLERGGSPSHLARLLTEQAEAKAVLGLPAEALREYEHALIDLDRCGLAREAARARCGMGTALLRLSRPTEAETALAAAATAFDDLGHATDRARVDIVRADLLLGNGGIREARRLACRALAALHDRPAAAASARLLLARIHVAAGEHDAGEAELSTALVAARSLDLAPLLADILDTRGRIHVARGRLDAAIEDLTAAVRHIERIRGSLQADRFRLAFLGDRAGTHEALVSAFLDRADANAIGDAFATAEKAKGRSMLDEVQGAIEVDDDSVPAGNDAAEERLRHQLFDVRSRLNALYSRLADDRPGHEQPGAVATWQTDIREQEEELDSLESRLGAMGGGRALLTRSSSLEDVQRHLEPGCVLLEFFIVESSIVAFVVERERAVVCRNLASVEEISGSLGRLRFQIDRALRPGAMAGRRSERLLDDTRTELGFLDSRLIAPLRKRINRARRLTIVPHGLLHLVPFHALWDGQQYLLDTHEMHYAPSASLLAHLQEDETPPLDSVVPLVVGVADTQAPSITDEARRVGVMLSCTSDQLFTDERATTAEVLRRAPDASLLHLACHGRYLRDNPQGSGLRFADRWLTVRDICSMRLNAELVTLSGCETGLNQVRGGDELIGLLRGFFVAGAKSLLVSQWRVDDESTTAFMSRLYGSRPDGRSILENKAAMVRDAQLALRTERPHPAFWAPFILTGAP